jgi:hypothetical protein
MKTSQVVKTLLTGVAISILGSAVAFAIYQVPFRLILSALAGYLAGRLIHRAGGRNGGSLAMATAGVSVALAFSPFLLPQLLAGNFQIFLMVPALIAVGFAIYQAR